MADRFSYQKQARTRGPFGAIIGLVVVFAALYLLFNIVSIGWSILGFVAPILLIISLILNRQVAINYGKMLLNTIKTDPLKGILYSVLSFIGHPLLFLYFFVRSYMTSTIKKKVDKNISQKKTEKGYTKYEEVVEDEDDFLELPDLDKSPPKEKLKDTGYENLFE